MPKLILFLVIIFVVALALGFLPGFSPFLPLILNLPLLFLVLAVFFMSPNATFSLALISGLLFDLYSPYFFGFYLIVFCLLVLLLKLVVSRLLEHKKILSFLTVNFLAVCFWQLCLWLAYLVANKLSSQDPAPVFPPSFFIYFILQIIVHAALIIIFYKILPFFRAQFTGDLIK